MNTTRISAHLARFFVQWGVNILFSENWMKMTRQAISGLLLRLPVSRCYRCQGLWSAGGQTPPGPDGSNGSSSGSAVVL